MNPVWIWCNYHPAFWALWVNESGFLGVNTFCMWKVHDCIIGFILLYVPPLWIISTTLTLSMWKCDLLWTKDVWRFDRFPVLYLDAKSPCVFLFCLFCIWLHNEEKEKSVFHKPIVIEDTMGKDSLFNKQWAENWLLTFKTHFLSYTICKNKFKIKN
jgi:hypothetical protein